MTDLEKLLAEVTPGPWWTDARYDGREMGCAIIAARTDCGPLPGNPTRGMVAWSSAILNTESRRCEANARLIAMAPDLARKVIAAEELAKAVRDVVTAYAEPDQLICCNGYMCGCRGSSVRDMADHYVREALAAWGAAQ